MNKILTTGLMTLTALSTIGGAIFAVKNVGAAPAAPVDPRRAAFVAALPADVVVPQNLPTSIEDSHMLEAWIRLYNHQETITLWDGSTTTGRQLAQYLLDNGIPVVWDIQNVCQGSCSVRYCSVKTGACSFEDGQPGAEPIFVHPLYANDIDSLVLILAHEIFHRTQSFGAAPDTRFEEFWAFKLESQIKAEGAMNFAGFDPLAPRPAISPRVSSPLMMPGFPQSYAPA